MSSAKRTRHVGVCGIRVAQHNPQLDPVVSNDSNDSSQ
jgi:hypothetical protein